MKIELSIFESFDETKNATIRGLIVLSCLILFDLIWFFFTNRYYPINKKINYYTGVLAWFILSSALAVQIPNNYSEALVYSGLVGLVVYGIYNFTNLTFLREWNISITIMDLMWGVINCCITGTILYYIYWNNINYFKNN